MIRNAWQFWFKSALVCMAQRVRFSGSVAHNLIGRYATQMNLGAQSFGISPAIRLVLSANELFYPQIRG
ncbi:hypothetical protein CG015_18205 [Vibrio anguillarum]|nr:hypothetical protein CG015_18205 [Vibrio anguillarum]